ncbi:CSLREA domain-containing protein [Verrucomicrobiaceae bacterium 227]
MTTTPAKKHSCRRSLVLSLTKRRALRRSGQQSLRYWKFITHCFTSLRRRTSRSLFAIIKRMRTAFGALALAFCLPTVVQAETFTVTTASDLSSEDDSQLTLREAIVSANETPGPDTIDFAEELSGAVLTLAQGELVINDDLEIDASSLNEAPIIDADQKSRVMHFTAPEGDLELTKLTLRNGMVTEDDSLGANGGGILFRSKGELTLMASTISGNSAVGTRSNSAYGGGIYSDWGAITITNSTISGNSATGSYGYGGGIKTWIGAVTLINSSLNGNFATSTYDACGNGGCIRERERIVTRIEIGGAISTFSGTTALTNSTVRGGGIRSSSGPLIITNSIVAGNSASDSFPDLAPPSDPANLLEVSNSVIGNSTGARLNEAKVNLNNITDVDPQLAPLADNGGPTWTMLPFPGSPVINAGTTTDLSTDQRGFAHSGTPNIGAVEYQGPDDLALLLDTDIDHDGNSYLVERALGTDPFRNDPNNPSNLFRPQFNPEGQPTLSFGIADDALPGTIWVLERSTDLVTFEEIYTFDGTTDFAIEGIPIKFARTSTNVSITDEAPPARGTYYRFRAIFKITN